ncbi:Dynein light chain, partial [Curvularia kusanoi]
MASDSKSDVHKQEAQIKSADMSEEMQNEAIEVAQQAMEQFTIEKDIAQFIKKEFDNRKGATWHCIVGRNFGSFVTHETKHFIYFYLGHCAILLFKTQRSQPPAFQSALKGAEHITVQCQNCGNFSGRVMKRWEWFTFCFVPIIPFSLKPYHEVGCHICNFWQDVKYRPDVQQQMNNGAAGQQPAVMMHGGNGQQG